MVHFAPNMPVIYKLDLLLQILQYLSWEALLLWDYMPGVGPEARQNEVRRRVFTALEPFIPRIDIGSFFDYLEGSRGLIVGSVVRQILWFGGSNDGSTPFNLNIVIPRSGTDEIHRFFTAKNYTHTEGLVSDRYQPLVSTIELYTKTNAKGRTIRISVSHSRNSALSVVIGSPSTAGMNGMTRHAIFTFYPELLQAGEGLWLVGASEDEVDATRVDGRKLTLYGDNSHWQGTCGYVCPMIWRKTLGDKGIGEYEWNPRLEELKPQKGKNKSRVQASLPECFKPLEGEALGFRMVSRCRNDRCKNCQLYEERLKYFVP